MKFARLQTDKSIRKCLDDNLQVINESDFNAQFGGASDIPTINESEFNALSNPTPTTVPVENTWGSAARFVGKSFGEGLTKTADLFEMLRNPLHGTTAPKFEDLFHNIFGKPEDEGYT